MNNIDYDEYRAMAIARAMEYELHPLKLRQQSRTASTENSSTSQGWTQDLGVEPPVYSNQVTLDGADEPNQVQIETEPKNYQGINHPWYYRYPFSDTLDSADEPKEIETEPKDLWIPSLLPPYWSYRHQVTGLDHADEPNEVQIETERNQGIYLPWFSYEDYYEDQVSAFKVSQVPSSQAGEDDQWNKQLTIDDLHELLSALINATLVWFELGLALKIKVSTLEGIDSNKSKNTDKARMREMLAHWLRSSSSRTWSDICKGLRSETVQQDVLADAIERKYQGTGTGMSRKKRKTSSM